MKESKTILYLILILALGLRAGRCLLVNRIDKDSVIYIQMAEDGVQKGIKHTFDRNPRIPPLYVFGMAAGEWAGLGAENTGRLISVLAGAFLPLAVFLMAGCILKGNNMALIAAFLTAIHPSLIRISAEIMRDSLSVSLNAFALAFACMAAYAGWKSWKWYLTGLFSALATLTRTEGIEIVFVLLIWSGAELYLNRSEFRKTFKQITFAAVAVVVVFSLLTVPVQIALGKTSSSWKVFDFRVSSYVQGFLKRSEKEVLEKEDT